MKTAFYEANMQTHLGEKSGPVGLDLDASRLADGGDLLGGDGDVVVSQDEGGVDTGKFAGE